ncbi:MAG: tRNA 2-selenouridine(34) synthase MnmH [Clostridiales bacterium]|jgi:tRNA 2-selenouridine synthase|nr:tRNA 2-selenouridine(34) synthase MnmH [Clostridiales bacterium]
MMVKKTGDLPALTAAIKRYRKSGRTGTLRALLSVEQFLENMNQYFIVDVRSPLEYAEASIPGAVNIPLFDDQERAVVGTTYKQEGTDQAKMVGLSLVSPRLPKMVEKIISAAAGREIVLYCWRGGMRSRSIFTLLEALGYPVLQLVGGYKAFRRRVNKFLNDATVNVPVIVLNGLTGVGKTLVIKELQQMNAPALDLEAMANHRGSAFGSVGLGKPRSQKDFEALLFLEIHKCKDAPFLIVEGEGKCIGSVVIPEFFYQAMLDGQHILLETGLETRVERIVDEYRNVSVENTEDLATAVLALQKRLGKNKCEELAEQVRQGEFHYAATCLCTEYYDSYYKDSRRRHGDYLAVINVDDVSHGAKEVVAVINSYFQGRKEHHGTV